MDRAATAEALCAAATKEASDAKEMARAMELDLEEVGEQLREESVGKEAAIADLHNVVEEITAEEEKLLDEIELLKSVDANRVISFRRTERELKLELEAVLEERDALATELEDIRRNPLSLTGSPHRHLGADSSRGVDGSGGGSGGGDGNHTDGTISGDGDLQSELAALNQEVPTAGDDTAPFLEEISVLQADKQRMTKEVSISNLLTPVSHNHLDSIVGR